MLYSANYFIVALIRPYVVFAGQLLIRNSLASYVFYLPAKIYSAG
ncbi:hypothetical protein SAMN05428988_5412 [Chitinophaga sp. YR573]|nr:hypothetical protein SAMN05428988_5412 [Chitinophaga sp. YR573]